MTFQVGILGLGLMGTRMARALETSPHFSIARAFDADPKANEHFQSEFHCAIQGSAAELIEKAGLDLVYIATPPSSHLGFLRAAFQKGLPALVEKPLATDLDGARKLCAENPDAPAWVHFPFATLKGLETIENNLSTGAAGQPLRVEIQLQFSQWPRTWHHAGPWLAGPQEGGFLREVFSHFAYLTQRVLGPLSLQSKSVVLGGQGTETHAQASLEGAGIPVHLTAGVAGGAPDHNLWTLFCENQSFRVEDWSQVSWSDGGSWQPMPTTQVASGMPGFLSELAMALEGKGNRLPNLQSGIGVMEAVEGILRG